MRPAGGLLALAVLASPLAAPAAALPDLQPAGSAEVRAVRDGRTLLLADGRELRLVGIDVPLEGDRSVAPLARSAATALGDLVAHRDIDLYLAGNPLDRHGRLLAHAVANGVWLQGELLRRGLARVESFADNRAGIAAMLAIERRARRSRRGIWADPFYAVRRAEEAGRYAGTFQIVEGTVVDAATVEGQVFVNFAAEWRAGFRLRIAGDALRLCRAAGIDPRALAGERLRVRGYIDGGTRPTIEVTHPEQIEFL